MPGGVVDTPRDEEKWEKAKQIAAKAGRSEDYAYIMGIYKRMNPDHKFKKTAGWKNNSFVFDYQKTAHTKVGNQMGPNRKDWHSAIDKVKLKKKPGVRADDAATGLAAGTAAGAGVSGTGALAAAVAKNPKLLAKYPRLAKAMAAAGKKTPLAKALTVGALGGAAANVGAKKLQDSAKKKEMKDRMHKKVDVLFNRRDAMMKALARRRAMAQAGTKTASADQFAASHDSRGRILAQSFMGELEKIAAAPAPLQRLIDPKRVQRAVQNLAKKGKETQAQRAALGWKRNLPFSKSWSADARLKKSQKRMQEGVDKLVQGQREAAVSQMGRTQGQSRQARATLEGTTDSALRTRRSAGSPKPKKAPPEPAPAKPESSLYQAARLTGYGVMGGTGLYAGGKYLQHRKRKQQEQMYGGGGGSYA